MASFCISLFTSSLLVPDRRKKQLRSGWDANPFGVSSEHIVLDTHITVLLKVQEALQRRK